MRVLQGMSWVVPANAALLPHVADLAYHVTAGGAVLYATTRYGGGAVTVWDIDAATPVQVDSAAWTRADAAGASPALTLVDTAAGTMILGGGGASGALQSLATDAAGNITTSRTLGSHAAVLGGDLVHTLSVTLGDGQTAVYGGLAGAAGIGRVLFDAGGNIVEVRRTADSATTHADQVAGLASAVIDGQRWLFSLGGNDPGLTAWAIGPGGTLTRAASLGIDAGLWISGPSALASASAGGETFLIVGAAGSNSLSVVRVGPDGTMVPVDHVLDSLETRFAGITALATVTAGGQDWVVAGGADDGISLFRLLPGGRLLAEAHIPDGLAAGLADISALAMRATAGGIEISAASASEAGITRITLAVNAGLSLQAGPGGGVLTGAGRDDLLLGGAGHDRLSGAGGSDVLLDGGGSDTLSGGAGADVFVMAADGVADRITDFQPGTDRIDLSGWAQLRSAGQLMLVSTATGIVITWGDEVLVVDSANGRPIQPAQLRQADLFDLDRLWPQQFTDPAVVTPAGGDIIGTIRSERLVAGDLGNRVVGNGGSDTLTGGPGNDILTGGAGRDLLDGGAGRNILEGGLGNDHYIIRSQTDQIRGEIGWSLGGGIDTVSSWISYALPQNIELLRLMGTADLNGTGNAAPEVLVGNSGANRLAGGGGNDRIVGKAGNDIIIGGTGRDELVGDEGADTFVYLAASDSRPGIENRDFINGFDRGTDHIDLSLIDANPGRAGDQAFTFIGNQDFSGTAGQVGYRSYGGNWCIVSADLDGDRVADMQIFVNLVSWLGRDDFIL